MRGTRRSAMTRKSSMQVILERSDTGRGSWLYVRCVVPIIGRAFLRQLQTHKGVKSMTWQQVYNPFGSMVVSTALAAIPVVVMLVCLGFLHMKAHLAAGLGLLSALLIAIVTFGMPAGAPSPGA